MEDKHSWKGWSGWGGGRHPKGKIFEASVGGGEGNSQTKKGTRANKLKRLPPSTPAVRNKQVSAGGSQAITLKEGGEQKKRH